MGVSGSMFIPPSASFSSIACCGSGAIWTTRQPQIHHVGDLLLGQHLQTLSFSEVSFTS